MGIESGERLEDSGAGNGESANLTEPKPWRPYWPASLFSALQQQLGLRLEATKGQVDVLVIDYVDKPSSN